MAADKDVISLVVHRHDLTAFELGPGWEYPHEDLGDEKAERRLEVAVIASVLMTQILAQGPILE